MTKKRQYEKLQERARELAADFEELRDEMQDSYDNMPESLQDSENGQKMDARIDVIGEQISALDEIHETVWEEIE